MPSRTQDSRREALAKLARAKGLASRHAPSKAYAEKLEAEAVAKYGKGALTSNPQKAQDYKEEHADSAALDANAASNNAEVTGTEESHSTAARAHEAAAKAYRDIGEGAEAKRHDKKAVEHRQEAGKTDATDLASDKAASHNFAQNEDAAKEAGEDAYTASNNAEASGDHASHVEAAKLHTKAAEAHHKTGNKEKVDWHTKQAKEHEQSAKALQTGSRGGSFYVNAAGNKVYMK